MGLSPGFSDRSHLPFLNDGSMKNEWWFSIIDVIEILTADLPTTNFNKYMIFISNGKNCA
jgi:hypothetical protein